MEPKIHEDLIKIEDYKLLGELPNPFVFKDGSEVKTKADWARRRAEMASDVIDLQYGAMPPAPEFLTVEPMYLGGAGGLNSYRITSGTRANPVTFIMYMFRAKTPEKAPVAISGDLCFAYAFDKEYLNAFLDHGISFVAFNRTELAPDIAGYNLRALDDQTGEYALASDIYNGGISDGNCGGQLKKAYPDCTFGAVGAWAWGYSRCVDALEILGNADLNLIAFTGHSRGGKTAALAGALDERAAIVNPNATCAGAYSSYRIQIEATTETGERKPSEPLSSIYRHFPAWLGNGMKEYIGREEELPFDSHFLKAMVAPRVLLVTEAASDIWANPVGSYQTTEAAREVYRFLGCEENIVWHFRSGKHFHRIEDVRALVEVIERERDGKPLSDAFFKKPFRDRPEAYSWRAPIRNED